MKFTSEHRSALRAVLDGTYTPLDVRGFVQLCYALALPLIRAKIHRGKLNLEILGMTEVDVVYDCLADLFRRDSNGSFVQVRTFFQNQPIDVTTCHVDEVLLALRRLVFGKVHTSLVRLYGEADSTLGKILRNLLLELERSGLFEHEARFGETFLIVSDVDPCLHLPPVTTEFLHQRFSQVVSVRDSIPVMVKKLHEVLLAQEEYQRAVPLVTAGLLFKKAYALGREAEEAEAGSVERQTEADDVCRIAELVCKDVAAKSRKTYLGKGKRTADEFDKYMDAVKEILLSEFAGGNSQDSSYFEHLKALMPGLSKVAYARRHRTVMEYLAKRAKRQMMEELRRQ
jgi:hypothetical protein